MAQKAVSHILEGNANFSNKLYDILAREEGNVFYSPLSAHAILSLVYQGAAGETAKSFEKGLQISGTKIAAEGYQNLMGKLNGVKDVTLHIANKVFVHHERQLKKEFHDVSKNNFLAECENIAFVPDNVAAAGQINSWVEKKTNDKIKNLIDPSNLNQDTRLVLVNAIYFKGDWLHKFEPTATRKEKFYLNETDTVMCEMMHITKKFRYGEDSDLDAQIVSLPYKNENFSLMIILPRSKNGIKDLEKKLVTKNLTDLQKNLWQDEVVLSLPKFKIETTIELKDPLTELGMGVIFSNGADFPNMLEGPEALAVSKVIQKAFIEVNEEGAEAAAATGIQIQLMCLPTVFEVTADHPFIFALIHKENQKANALPLFVGKLNQIEQS